MNNVKDELKEVLEERKRFTQGNADAVLQRIENKASRKNRFKMPAIAVSFIALLAFVILLFTNSETTKVQTATEDSLLASLHERMDGDQYIVVYSEVGIVADNDAIVAHQSGGDEGPINTEYFLFENNEWVQAELTGGVFQDGVFWSSSGPDSYLFAGVLRNEGVKSVLVGRQEVMLLDLGNGWSYWYSVMGKRVNSVVVEYVDGTFKRLEESTLSVANFGKEVPIVATTEHDARSVFTYNSDTMDQGNHDYTLHPLIIDSTIKTYKIGNVILYKNEEGAEIISRVLGLPGDTFEIQNGTIIVNTIPLNIHIGHAKIGGETVFESYVQKLGNHLENVGSAKEIFHMNLASFEVAADEIIVVPDNWMRGEIEAVSLDNIEGVVLGYDDNAYKSEWSATERTLYEQFKETNDPEVFRDVEPVTIARVYFYASFLLDARTVYRMYTTRDEYVAWSEATHMREETITEQEKSRKSALENARIMAISNFTQTDEISGTLHLGEGEDMVIFNLILSETGIWQVSFMPMQ